MDASLEKETVIGLIPWGDPSAAACEGDFCAVPERDTQAMTNRTLDDDAS